MFRSLLALLVESPDLLAAGRGRPDRGVPSCVHARDSGQAQLPDRQPASVIVAQFSSNGATSYEPGTRHLSAGGS